MTARQPRLIHRFRTRKNEISRITMAPLSKDSRNSSGVGGKASRSRRLMPGPGCCQDVTSMTAHDFGLSPRPMGQRAILRTSLVLPEKKRAVENFRARRPIGRLQTVKRAGRFPRTHRSVAKQMERGRGVDIHHGQKQSTSPIATGPRGWWRRRLLGQLDATLINLHSRRRRAKRSMVTLANAQGTQRSPRLASRNIGRDVGRDFFAHPRKDPRRPGQFTVTAFQGLAE